jgi:hypothetical protein
MLDLSRPIAVSKSASPHLESVALLYFSQQQPDF